MSDTVLWLLLMLFVGMLFGFGPLVVRMADDLKTIRILLEQQTIKK